jgi:hypothetical protein
LVVVVTEDDGAGLVVVRLVTVVLVEDRRAVEGCWVVTVVSTCAGV